MQKFIITLGDFYGDGHMNYRALQFDYLGDKQQLIEHMTQIAGTREFAGEYEEPYISGKSKQFLVDQKASILQTFPQMNELYANDLRVQYQEYEKILFALLVYIKFRFMPELEFANVSDLQNDLITHIGYGLYIP